jgi:hypothetical protein
MKRYVAPVALFFVIMYRQVLNLEQENQRLRHSDQIKEDALATLSDQVMKLMVEVQELKKQK